MTNIDTATLFALKSILEKEAKGRRKLTPGDHEVSDHVELDVEGMVNVSEDEQYTPTVSIPLKVTMALFMRYTGVTGAHAHEALTQAMKDALKIDQLASTKKKEAVEAIEELANLEEAEAKVKEGLADLPKKSRRGKVNVSAEVRESRDSLDEVEAEEAKAS